MSNQAHDHVHRLIRSMSPSEKRYFKLYTARHRPTGGGNHDLLFNAIAAMEQYHESQLLNRFKDKGFVARFPIAKRRLYEAVLRSLAAYHAESSVDARLRRQMHEVEILFQRALYEDADKLLHGAVKLAEHYERPHILVEAQQWRRKLIERSNYAGTTQADLMMERAEAGRLRELFAEVDALWALKSDILLTLYQRGPARSAEQIEEITRSMDQPVARGEVPHGSAKARFLFNHLHGVAAFAMGDLEGCHEHLARNRVLLITERDRFLDEPNLALSVLSNLTYVCARTGRFEAGKQHLQEFQRAPSEWRMPENEDLDLKLFATSYSLELTLHTQLGDFDKAKALIPQVERGLIRHGNSLGALRKAGFHYQVAYTCLGIGDLGGASRWCHRLLNEVRVDEHEEIVCFARMLDLLVRIESGDHALLSYALRNTERYLRGKAHAHRYEDLFLDLVRSLRKARNAEATRGAFEHFRTGLLPLENDPLERSVFDHLDPIAWAESKLTGRPFAVLVRERALRSARAA
ncbi:MAG: hypothetical protein KA175_07790 [Flavobacteriales bacterium]|nr:hypothetical protein [Flavobacteriales bacterium]MBP6697504.1 hypothetical protein [Flavobacteriales bacterium]